MPKLAQRALADTLMCLFNVPENCTGDGEGGCTGDLLSLGKHLNG